VIVNRRWLLCVAILGLCSPVRAERPDADNLAARIDRALAGRWSAARATPAPAADDAEFFRRLHLDLGGRIPSVAEVRAFLNDPSPSKRRQAAERLLEGPAYVAHFTNVWRAALLPDGGANVDNVGLRLSFEAWLRARLAENTPFDRMAREIFAADPGVNMARGGFGGMAVPGPGVSPAAFSLALENKPENLAGGTSRLLLGVRLECAQCHDHPFADWTREQFWQYAAFFGPPGGKARPEATIPGTGKSVKATFPDGTEPDLKKNARPRAALAAWATAPDNPYFARATANRVWAHFFGTGLAEPIDDLLREGKDNPLLDELARAFADSGFDLKYLCRAIISTRAYQLSSAATDPTQDDPRLFARMGVKGLTTEQVVASLIEATGHRDAAGRAPGPDATARLTAELNGAFARQPGKPTEFQTSIPQALALMNGKFVSDATGLELSGTLAAVANAPFLDTAGRVETLYLAALGRLPTGPERTKVVGYVEKGGPSGDPDKALADVFWALLNSSEFALNH
jgi:hypothetical protein